MKKQKIWILCLFGMAFLASCNNDNEVNKYGTTDFPMEFTAVVGWEGLTRASADNIWTGDGTEKVSVSDGNKTVGYTIVNATGEMLPTDENSALYWASATEAQPVTAWYPATADNSPITSWNVQSNQTGDGFQKSDLLMCNADVSFQGNRTLPFIHQTAKVIVHLQGDGETDAELEGATLKINNVVLEGVISNGKLEKKSDTDDVQQITPKRIADTEFGYLASYEALLIPQLVEGVPFIEIETSNKTYQYTPQNNNGLLKGAHQNIYYVIVGKPGISVTVKKDGTSWEHEEDQNIGATQL